jgi:hypothetical protein
MLTIDQGTHAQQELTVLEPRLHRCDKKRTCMPAEAPSEGSNTAETEKFVMTSL